MYTLETDSTCSTMIKNIKKNNKKHYMYLKRQSGTNDFLIVGELSGRQTDQTAG